MSSLNLSSLNINQKTAVDWNDGPLLVLAGPGSGKTRVLTYRIARLLSETEGKKLKILALTFTKKASVEMRERVNGLIPNEIKRALLTTFHSFCGEVLRQHGSHVGLTPNFIILSDDIDRENVLLDVINKNFYSGAHENDIKYLKTIDYLSSNFIEDDQVESLFLDIENGKKISILYKEYKNELLNKNYVDYNTLLYFTHRLFTSNETIKKQYQITYKYICVDEFQDTNFAQFQVLTHLVNQKTQNIFVVADDDQIIYQWNGASPERLNELRNMYNMNVLQLPENYRCPPEVVDIANKLIEHNSLRDASKTPLVSKKEKARETNIHLMEFTNENEELEWIAEQIKRTHINTLNNCVIIARTKSLLNKASAILSSNGIQSYLVERKTDFVSPPLIFLHTILKMYNSRNDLKVLKRLCKSFFQIEGINIAINDITKEAPFNGDDFLITFLQLSINNEGISSDAKEHLQILESKVQRNQVSIDSINRTFNWFEVLQSNETLYQEDVFDDYIDEKKIWLDIQGNVLKEFGSENFSIYSLLQEVELSPKVLPIPDNSVRCFTIHNSKGLEFNHVYFIGLAEDVLPSFYANKKGDDSFEMQEERRNCFVAITRTQLTLTLTYARKYNGWEKEPSRFLYEMGLL